mgnify:CR=1 FL=1
MDYEDSNLILRDGSGRITKTYELEHRSGLLLSCSRLNCYNHGSWWFFFYFIKFRVFEKKKAMLEWDLSFWSVFLLNCPLVQWLKNLHMNTLRQLSLSTVIYVIQCKHLYITFWMRLLLGVAQYARYRSI